MNLNFRKTALLAGICSVFSLGYAPQLFAVSSKGGKTKCDK